MKNVDFFDLRLLVQFGLSIMYFFIFYRMLKVRDGRIRVLLLRERMALAFLLLIGSVRGIAELCGNPYNDYANGVMFIISIVLFVMGYQLSSYLNIDLFNHKKDDKKDEDKE